MNAIHIEFARGFRGEDVVLLAMDTPRARAFAAAMKRAENAGSSQLDSFGRTHEIYVKESAADIELHELRVVWRLDQAKASEIISDLSSLIKKRAAGHYYVDNMSSPASTLIISLNEGYGR